MTRRLERHIAASLERSRATVRLALRRIAREAELGRTDAAAIEVLMDACTIRGRLLQISDDYGVGQDPRTDKKASAPCPPSK